MWKQKSEYNLRKLATVSPRLKALFKHRQGYAIHIYKFCHKQDVNASGTCISRILYLRQYTGSIHRTSKTILHLEKQRYRRSVSIFNFSSQLRVNLPTVVTYFLDCLPPRWIHRGAMPVSNETPCVSNIYPLPSVSERVSPFGFCLRIFIHRNASRCLNVNEYAVCYCGDAISARLSRACTPKRWWNANSPCLCAPRS